MNYFIDTEFLEGTQKKWFGKTKPTIDLISIGIVAEDGREYYAINKDFNLKEAWNRYDIKIEQVYGDMRNHYPEGIKHKVYWIRDNVLKPIFRELCVKDEDFLLNKCKGIPESNLKVGEIINGSYDFILLNRFTYKNFKRLINKYGKTNKQIAKEIKHFVANRPIESNKEQWILDYDTKDVQFYGYYADYDWVVFCWLFGKMINLPKGFPMYCVDLKQTLDDYADINYCIAKNLSVINSSFEDKLNELKSHKNYPKQTNEHNALADARWNYQLYKFLNTL